MVLVVGDLVLIFAVLLVGFLDDGSGWGALSSLKASCAGCIVSFCYVGLVVSVRLLVALGGCVCVLASGKHSDDSVLFCYRFGQCFFLCLVAFSCCNALGGSDSVLIVRVWLFVGCLLVRVGRRSAVVSKLSKEFR